ncbi:glycosyltransferase [Arthrobacter sp. ISL-65]|uniref:glycosyltransferase n=1 Tax=Arthrobacter sp. ISL-65 TaxID=2819112 RepID=UPI001BE7969D|nr:glycosyltransferase [Arthrobacter sp. ISL-65]MBT2549821.1 glycosyltransferase [Arthrobacter sp. ISL-65]
MSPRSEEPVDVSVVIPTNRMHRWLDQAVTSVLQQTGVTLEVVLYLDNVKLSPGTDWADDPRVRVVSGAESQGVGHALREACRQARGEFIARLDSDDVALPGRLARQVAYLRTHADTVAVTGQAPWIDEEGVRIGAFGHSAGSDVRGKLLEQNVLVQSAIMFRATDYLAVGGYNPLKQMEDYDLWLRLALRGRMAVLEDDVVEYRIHPDQTSRGVHPRASYVRTIFAGRKNLAESLGKSAASQLLRNTAFRTALYMMYYLPPSVIRRIRTLTSR